VLTSPGRQLACFLSLTAPSAPLSQWLTVSADLGQNACARETPLSLAQQQQQTFTFRKGRSLQLPCFTAHQPHSSATTDARGKAEL